MTPRFAQGPLALLRHAALCLRLNFRSPKPLLYGFVVPLLFVIAFGAIYRADPQPLRAQLGQLLTLALLGGACFGLPTALVAEREAGLWRMHRLLPVHSGWLLAGVLLARVVLLAAACLLQVCFAHLVFGTPWPQAPALLLGAFLVCSLSFLGLGLLVAALADSIPSVQALGQCLFLPMLMVGGVAVPLGILPEWAQLLSGFMPGRYAVALLNAGCTDPLGLLPIGFNVGALTLIGVAAGALGLTFFRWDSRLDDRQRARLRLLAPALGAWLLVGGGAWWSGRLSPDSLVLEGLQDLSPALLASISIDDVPDDKGLVTRLAAPFPEGKLPASLTGMPTRLRAWADRDAHSGLDRVRRLLSAASLADAARDPREGDLARLCFNILREDIPQEELARALGWLILRPEDGRVPTAAAELGLSLNLPEEIVRQRNTWYAKKLLGRVLGNIEQNRPQVP